MAKLRKVRNKNWWKLPYAYAGRTSCVDIWLIEDDGSPNCGEYMVCCGAVVRLAETFEKAEKTALEFTHGGAL